MKVLCTNALEHKEEESGFMSRIPKKIHFCWLGGEGEEEYPELIQKCMNSWKEKLPDYEIKCWNTENFDVNICQYTKEAFQAKKYAFVSDYVRLYALYNEGGIYLDSDIEVLKRFDDLLENSAFTGFEKNDRIVAAWIFGSEKENPIFKEFLDYYKNKVFILPNGEYDLTPNPIPVTNICVKNGLTLNGNMQKLDYITVYPRDYFCPYNQATEELNITENTYCIHYFNGMWIDNDKKQIIVKRKQIVKKYGKIIGYLYYGFGVWKVEGARQLIKEVRFFLNL